MRGTSGLVISRFVSWGGAKYSFLWGRSVWLVSGVRPGLPPPDLGFYWGFFLPVLDPGSLALYTPGLD
jgi:hypothetical protein